MITLTHFIYTKHLTCTTTTTTIKTTTTNKTKNKQTNSSIATLDAMPTDPWWKIENRKKLFNLKSAAVVYIMRFECLHAQ